MRDKEDGSLSNITLGQNRSEVYKVEPGVCEDKRSSALKDQLFLQNGQHPALVLRKSWPSYQTNVVRVVGEIEEYCGSDGLTMESVEVQELLKAADHLDCQHMERGGYTFAPAFNKSRCILEGKTDYCETELPAMLLEDVDKKVLPAELAACQLGVTTTMIFSALALNSTGTRSLALVVRKTSGKRKPHWECFRRYEEKKLSLFF